MHRNDRRQHQLHLEQRAAELVAQQTELQHTLRRRKLGPIDHAAMTAELAVVQAELDGVRAALEFAKRERNTRLGRRTPAPE